MGPQGPAGSIVAGKVTTDAQGVGTFTFPSAFSTVPFVAVSVVAGSGVPHWVQVTAISTLSVSVATFRARQVTGLVLTAANPWEVVGGVVVHVHAAAGVV